MRAVCHTKWHTADAMAMGSERGLRTGCVQTPAVLWLRAHAWAPAFLGASTYDSSI